MLRCLMDFFRVECKASPDIMSIIDTSTKKKKKKSAIYIITTGLIVVFTCKTILPLRIDNPVVPFDLHNFPTTGLIMIIITTNGGGD